MQRANMGIGKDNRNVIVSLTPNLPLPATNKVVPAWNLKLHIHRAPLIGGPQVAWMLQSSWGRNGKQEQEQNSPNLGPAYKWSPVILCFLLWEMILRDKITVPLSWPMSRFVHSRPCASPVESHLGDGYCIQLWRSLDFLPLQFTIYQLNPKFLENSPNSLSDCNSSLNCWAALLHPKYKSSTRIIYAKSTEMN